MERYFRFLLLGIFVMFGLVNNAKAEDIPFEFHTPYQNGVQVLGGGSGTDHGSYYNEAPYHDGTSYYCIDLNVDMGVNDNSGYSVTATAGGTVVADRESGHNGYGTAFSHDIAIRHEDGYYSLYMHLRSNSVSYGDEVRAGQVIGIEGANGTTSSHLHFCIFNSSGNSVKPSPMDGVMLEDEELEAGQSRDDNVNSLAYGQYYGHSITSNNREVTEEAVTAIKAAEAVLYADGLIDHQTEDAHWYGGDDATDATFIIKDWDGGTWGSGDDWVALTFDPSNVDQTEAYVLRHGFFEIYRTYGGPDTFGAPLGDEMDTTRPEYTPHDSYWGTSKSSAITNNCGPTSQFTSVQRFGSATFCWYEPEWRACLSSPDDAGYRASSLPYCYQLTDDALHQDTDRDASEVDISATDIDQSTWDYTSQVLTNLAAVDLADLSSSVTCAVDAEDSLYVVLNGQDGRIYEFESTNDGVTWTSTPLTSVAAVPLSAPGTTPHLFIDPDTGDRYVTFMGVNARINLFHYNGTSWTAVELTSVVAAPLADLTSSPYGYIANGIVYVVFQGDDQRIWRFSVTNGTTYGSLDLTGRASVQYAMSGTSPMAVYNQVTGEHHIVFQGINQRIQRLTFNGSTWSSVEITSVVNSDLLDSASSPMTYVDPFTGYVYIVINGVNERIDLIADYHTSWDSDELTSLISVPLTEPGTSPTGYIDPFTGNHVITFQGEDGRINQFEGPDMTAPIDWTSIDQTSQAAVEFAAPGTSPGTCVDPFSGVRHLVFVGDNGRVQYLRYGP